MNAVDFLAAAFLAAFFGAVAFFAGDFFAGVDFFVGIVFCFGEELGRDSNPAYIQSVRGA